MERPSRFEVGLRLKKARKAAGLSQQKVADLVGTGRRHYIKWERGDHIPSEAFRTALSDVLSVDLSDLDVDEEEEELMSLLARIAEIQARRKLGSTA